MNKISSTAIQKMEDTLENENFYQRLDQLILGFRTETIQEFTKTKGRLNHQKESTVDNERKICNALINTKQQEIDSL